jgi:hypothetical protein
MNHKPPPQPTEQLTAMEAWYLECLKRWTAVKGKGQPPSIAQLAAWCKRSQTAVYDSLLRCEAKGYVSRLGGDNLRNARKFVAVETP